MKFNVSCNVFIFLMETITNCDEKGVRLCYIFCILVTDYNRPTSS